METSLSEKLLSVEFEKVRGFMVSKPMYYKSEVDAFLQKSTAQAELLEKELRKVKRKLDEAEGQSSKNLAINGATQEELGQYEKTLSEKAKKINAMEKSARHMLILAEEKADSIRSQTEVEVQEIIVNAKNNAEELLREAKKRKDTATFEAEEIVKDAKIKLEGMVHQQVQINDELSSVYELIGKTVNLKDNHAQVFRNEQMMDKIQKEG
jgi:cell division septum initiation protein DivIVA